MEKANEASVPLHMAFVDYKKAFDIDTVKHEKLWNVLKGWASMAQQWTLSGVCIRISKRS